MPEAAIYVDYENLWIELNKLAAVSHERVSDILTKIADDNKVPRLRDLRFAYATWWDDRLKGAMAAIAGKVFSPVAVVSAGPGKNTADAMMASDIRDKLESSECPNLFILATGDHYFGPTADAIHRRGKRIIVVGVSRATNRDLLAASDLPPILLDKVIGETRPGAAPGTGTLTAMPSTSSEELAANLLRVLRSTIDAMRSRGFQLSTNPYIIFSEALKALVASSIFRDEDEASTWLNIAMKENVLSTELVPHQSGRGSITQCRLNHEHQLVRAFLAGVHLSVFRALYTATIGHNRPYASFNVWLQALQEDQARLSNPALAIRDAAQFEIWKSYLIKEAAVSEEARTSATGKPFKAFRPVQNHPLVQEVRVFVQAPLPTPQGVAARVPEAVMPTPLDIGLPGYADNPLLSVESRTVLSLHHMLERSNRTWLVGLPTDERWLPITTFNAQSPVARAIGRTLLREVISDHSNSEEDLFLIGRYQQRDNPELFTTGLRINYRNAKVLGLLRERDDFIRMFAEFLSNRDGVEDAIALRWLSEEGGTLAPVAEGWLAIMEQEEIIVREGGRVGLRHDDAVVRKALDKPTGIR